MCRDSIKMCEKMFSQKSPSLSGLSADKEPGTFILP